jgi:hypothetical protein
MGSRRPARRLSTPSASAPPQQDYLKEPGDYSGSFGSLPSAGSTSEYRARRSRANAPFGPRGGQGTAPEPANCSCVSPLVHAA